jgi:outer membrane protein OmpA-like peptidoglycan-associated protein
MELTTKRFTALILSILLTSAGCAPISSTNKPTGNAIGPLLGGGAAVATLSTVGASKNLIGLGGVIGAGLGYYATTLRFASAGIVHIGGQVYTLGDYLTIELPTDQLFDANTADLLPDTDAVLDSVVKVLNRYPNHNILISGNTSGSGTAKFEQQLSENRAREVAAYLWSHGITMYLGAELKQRKLIYVGYGDYFPIANNLTIKSTRKNSRIQITAYPTEAQLSLSKDCKEFNNIGSIDESNEKKSEQPDMRPAFSEQTPNSNGTSLEPDNFSGDSDSPIPTTHSDETSGQFQTENPDGAVTNYNKSASLPQTRAGVTEVKQGGYKDDASFTEPSNKLDFKSAGSLKSAANPKDELP